MSLPKLALSTLATASLLLMSGAALSQTKTLYIGMNGGTMEKSYVEHVFPAFEKANNVKVVVVPGTSSEVLAKVQASKDKPPLHVMFLDDGIMVRAIGMGLCQKMKPSAALNELYPVARMKGDMATGISLGMTGLAYNKKMYTEKGWAAPTSWMDLADPKLKGKVVVQSLSSSTFGLHAFMMFNRIQGGDDRNVEPGFKAWGSTIGPNVIEYIPNSAKISEMVQTNEAALFPLTPTQVEVLKGKGVPVEYAQPKEGSVVLITAQCVVANTPDVELAHKLAEHLLGAEAQSKLLAVAAQLPTNSKATASGAGAATLSQIAGYMKTAVAVDWDSVNDNRPKWNERWNKTVEK